MDGQRLRMPATDSIRFTSRHAPVAVMRDTDAPSAIIPSASLADLGRLLPDGDEAVGIRIGTGPLSFQAKQWPLHTALIDGAYPEVDKLLPRDDTTELIVETAPLREATDRVVILAGGDSAMMLHLTNQHGIKLNCRNEGAGDAEEVVHLREMRGEPLSICVKRSLYERCCPRCRECRPALQVRRPVAAHHGGAARGHKYGLCDHAAAIPLLGSGGPSFLCPESVPVNPQARPRLAGGFPRQSG
ncbi:hypothetical protein [Paenibacillus thiaminolyticus]|uniref:DNA polymerase III subunit beta family protein n=1 Tax=Paenibacillus thiaminolyticus TaxID=49283 RepID=UPI002542C449|nr:hypothetical protein [Paenibacillus thiaminolyticus]WII37499.1 hypothetical protein O0V01_28655 [Paenibacillus thiaminolyticus]